MKEIYEKIWNLARPYYERGRPMDVGHIQWMMEEAEKICAKEGIDDSLLLPLVILHDVGYAEVPKENPFNLDIRKAHMKAGVEVAEEILRELEYPEEKIKKIAYYVSVHDNWALGDNEIYKKEKILGVFTDLDFTWMAYIDGFEGVREILNKEPNEMIEYIDDNEKLVNRPFCTETIKKIFEHLLKERKNDSKNN